MDIKEYHLGIILIIITTILLASYYLVNISDFERKYERTICENAKPDYWKYARDANATHCTYYLGNSRMESYEKKVYEIINGNELGILVEYKTYEGDD